MLRKYYDLHLTTKRSFGTDSAEEIIRMAERLGFEAIAIADKIDNEKDMLAARAEIEATKPKIKVLVGAEIIVDNASKLSQKVNQLRPYADLILVSGGDLEVNRAACENPKVDILAHPELKRRDGGVDHVMAEFAARNGVAIELNFREFLQSYRKIRSHILSHMRRNAMLAEKYGAPLIVTSAAERAYDMRSGRDLASLAYLAGLSTDHAIRAVSDAPEMIIRRAIEEKDAKNVIPGVRIIKEKKPEDSE